MALSFLMHGQLKHYGITDEVVRGLKRRQPDESWRLPEQAKCRLRLLLADLGFEASREIWVREVPAQRVFRLYQPSGAVEKEVASTVSRPQYRLTWLRGVTRGGGSLADSFT